MKRPLRVTLWEGIQAFAAANNVVRREQAVVAVEKAVDDEVELLLRRVAPLLLAMNARSGIGGQMITDYECVVCGEEKAHGNSAAPVVCPDCARELRSMLRCCCYSGCDEGHGRQLHQHANEPCPVHLLRKVLP